MPPLTDEPELLFLLKTDGATGLQKRKQGDERAGIFKLFIAAKSVFAV